MQFLLLPSGVPYTCLQGSAILIENSIPHSAGVFEIKVIIIIPLDSPIFDDLTRQDGEEEMVDNFVNQVH